MSNDYYVEPPKKSVFKKTSGAMKGAHSYLRPDYWKRKLIHLVIVVPVVFIICGVILMKLTVEKPSVEFEDPAAEEFEYHYNAAYEGIIITAYNGEAQAIRIPAELDGEPVKQVSFPQNRNITHIALPDSVTVIGEGAFAECSSLTEIIIPNSVTKIGGGTFYGCSSLTEITIPDSITSIGVFAFEECSSLTEITIPDSVTEIGGGAFAECSSLTKIVIPDSVIVIDVSTFRECSSLVKITIPDSIIVIGEGAFEGCSSLTEITIPDSVTLIDERAFSGCDSLKVTYQGQKYTYANDPGDWWQ